MEIPDTTGQIPLNLRPDQNYSFDNFVQTPANEAALTLVQAWPNWPSAVLRLYGPFGSGKTHLGKAWAAKTGGTFVDDADLSDEADLFNQINRALIGDIPGLLLASELSPKAWETKLPDLKSRLLAAPDVALWEPDDDSLEPIVRALFAQAGRDVRQDVVIYILKHSDRSIEALKGLVFGLDKAAQAEKRDVTKAFTAKYLKRNS